MPKRNETDEFWQARKAERVQRVREKKQAKTPPCPVDRERLRADLQSSEAAVRARAARAVCPCRTDWETFEGLLDTLRRLTKDASPEVRANALHVFEDAFERDNEGPPTTPQALTNELVARRCQARWQPDAAERPAARPNEHDRRPRQPPPPPPLSPPSDFGF
jgi:hypothetical protein